ncbi:hypothetical protein NMG60_11022238 [Bertholletia excelsa]
MALPGVGSFSPPTATTSSADDPSKRVRKPYTITKSRESWTEPEHDKFLEALQLFDRDWKKIEAFIGSKTVIQIRSHAQKYFLKVQKSGSGEHLPPPRPKRKAAHPYPQKAPILSQVAGSFQTSPVISEPGYMKRPDSSSSLQNAGSSAVLSPRTNNSVQTVRLSHTTKGDIRFEGQLFASNCCSSTESAPRTGPTRAITEQKNRVHSLRVLPDFAQVYSFLGSVFDPNVTGHLQKIKKMEPIDVETVLLLMRNLSINLTSPDFEEHRKLLSSYKIDAEKDNSSGLNKNLP